MRIAVHAMTKADRPMAEFEHFRRLEIACGRRDWPCMRSDDPAAIIAFTPDLVLVEHFIVPKLTPFPTLGLLWNPPGFWEGQPDYIENIVTYDGHLFADPATRRHIRDLIAAVPAGFVEGTWVPGCQAAPLPQGERRGLAYFEVGWDRGRHRAVLQALARTVPLHRYGMPARDDPPNLPPRTPLPFDGESVVAELGRRTAALCFHSDAHRRGGTPSGRVFEAAMGGSVILSDEHAFVREVFGDAALYVDSTAPPETVAAAIARHLAWIDAHPDAAEAMRATAHRIVSERFTYDRLLDQLPALTAAVRAGWASPPDLADQAVTVVVRSGDRDLAMLDRALDSLERQTHPAVRALVVAWRDADAIRARVAARPGRLPVRVIESPDNGRRSTALWTGLAAVDTPFFAVLDDDDTVMPNHVAAGLATLAAYPGFDLAYSGAVAVDEPGGIRSRLLLARFDATRFRTENFIASNAWVARSDLLRRAGPDPELVVGEDYYLLLRFSASARFVPTWRLTAEYRRRADDPSHSGFADKLPEAQTRIDRRLHFAPIDPPAPPHDAVAEAEAERILRKLVRRRRLRKGLVSYLRDVRGLPARLLRLPVFLARHGLRGVRERLLVRALRPGR